MFLALIVASLLACGEDRSGLSGTWSMQGDDVVGSLRVVSGGCAGERVLVSLYGPGLATAGEVEAEAATTPDGPTWLYFPLETALGAGQAALRVQGRDARLPLGARPGEFDLSLALSPEPADAASLEAARASARAELDGWQAAWADGRFRLVEQAASGADGSATTDQLVGELVFRAELPPLVAVYDRWWWTGAPVAADRVDEGADLVLTFLAEPSLQGEEAQLRVNVPTGVAVVPADVAPTELDRVLRLVPGEVQPEERDAAMKRARAAADEEEQRTTVNFARQLAALATQEDGSCAGLDALGQADSPMLAGYELELSPGPDGCVVHIEPVHPQHRRRLRARVGPSGILDAGG